MFEQRFKIFLFLIVSIQCAICLRVFKLNTAKSNNDLAHNLKDILYKYADKSSSQYSKNRLYFHEKPNFRRSININNLSKTLLGKSTLVSRIIPHGYRSGKYEYDSKFNTIYKPLIRFHVKKPVKKIRELLDNSNEKPKVLGYVVVISKNNKLIKTEKNKNKKDISRLLEIIYPSNVVRTGRDIAKTLLDKSGEDVDEFEPGKVPVEESLEATTKPPVVIPAYPFWNYWTYSKTIYQDDCEGQLVKLGNVCISPSGHRRNIDR